MPTLIIDNYDSFTFNLVHQVAAITGEAPVVIRNDEKTWDEIRDLGFDHIIVSPGPGRPDNAADFGVSMDAIRNATVPVLGVCLGHQGIAVAFGGAILQNEPVHGRLRGVLHDGDELFAGIPTRFEAVRYHSLEVAEPLPADLKSIAWDFTKRTVMALRHVSRPIWGVQFHPESVLTDVGSTLLRNFLGTHKTNCDPEELFRRYYAGRAGAYWLDQWDGFSYMGAGVPERHTLASFGESLAVRLQNEPNREPEALPCPFTGGYIGYITYEGEAVVVRAENFLVIDHRANRVYFVGTPPEECAPRARKAHRDPTGVRYRVGREEYREQIGKCLEWIRAGESYELCLTNQLRAETDADPLEYYERLRVVNPAPHAAYLNFDGIEIACSSPEQFLKIDECGNVESRPIKGTLPRECDAGELLRNERFRAENLMIVDLVRNDLSRVCEVGSVKVPRLMEVESYATVHQLVSTISGRLRRDATAVDCIRAAFPGGSMTGAPKKRSVELLARLERMPRGIYSGAIGYLGFNGTADWNITIRTAVFEGGAVTIGVGGAIVAESDAEEEWREMDLKAQALLRALAA